MGCFVWLFLKVVRVFGDNGGGEVLQGKWVVEGGGWTAESGWEFELFPLCSPMNIKKFKCF